MTIKHLEQAKNCIAFIGGGNMASSLIGGLLANQYQAKQLLIAEPDPQQQDYLHQKFGVQTYADCREIITEANVLIFAVKPQILPEVAKQSSVLIQKYQPLVLSVVAGILTEQMEEWLGENIAIVRTMPNTPALVQTGATGLFANAQVNAEQKQLAESIMRAVGLTLWFEQEQQLNAVTALSGSGPAYFFYIMEILENIGIKLGLDPNSARLLTLETALGAAKLALESNDPPAILRQQVTSPQGTTAKAIEVMQQQQLDTILESALTAAYQRAEELSKQHS